MSDSPKKGMNTGMQDAVIGIFIFVLAILVFLAKNPGWLVVLVVAVAVAFWARFCLARRHQVGASVFAVVVGALFYVSKWVPGKSLIDLVQAGDFRGFTWVPDVVLILSLTIGPVALIWSKIDEELDEAARAAEPVRWWSLDRRSAEEVREAVRVANEGGMICVGVTNRTTKPGELKGKVWLEGEAVTFPPKKHIGAFALSGSGKTVVSTALVQQYVRVGYSVFVLTAKTSAADTDDLLGPSLEAVGAKFKAFYHLPDVSSFQSTADIWRGLEADEAADLAGTLISDTGASNAKVHEKRSRDALSVCTRIVIAQDGRFSLAGVLRVIEKVNLSDRDEMDELAKSDPDVRSLDGLNLGELARDIRQVKRRGILPRLEDASPEAMHWRELTEGDTPTVHQYNVPTTEPVAAALLFKSLEIEINRLQRLKREPKILLVVDELSGWLRVDGLAEIVKGIISMSRSAGFTNLIMTQNLFTLEDEVRKELTGQLPVFLSLGSIDDDSGEVAKIFGAEPYDFRTGQTEDGELTGMGTTKKEPRSLIPPDALRDMADVHGVAACRLNYGKPQKRGVITTPTPEAVEL